MTRTRLDELEAAVHHLVARADSVMSDARADGAGYSGTKTLTTSMEIDLGSKGWGEVEYYVTASYKVEFAFKSVKSVDWNTDAGPVRGGYPQTEIEKRLRRAVDSSGKRLFADLVEKL